MARDKKASVKAVVEDGATVKGGRMNPAPTAVYIEIPKPSPKAKQ